MGNKKIYLTTGEAAAVLSLDRDTVLRWIKNGVIPAVRTPGGHYRIHRNTFLTKVFESNLVKGGKLSQTPVPFCWEFHFASGELPDDCRNCIVYQSRTGRCYELCQLPVDIGHSRLFCKDSCQDCSYYNTYA